jgi:hypothetical protein
MAVDDRIDAGCTRVRHDNSRDARKGRRLSSATTGMRRGIMLASRHGTRVAPSRPRRITFRGGAMKATITVVGLALTTLLSAAPALADCELSCSAECKQETAICNSAANLESRIGRQVCQADAADALAICDGDAIDARADCVGMCGPDLKDCGSVAKANLKACKEQAKIELAGCENEVATLLAADKLACAEDAADCASSCIE